MSNWPDHSRNEGRLPAQSPEQALVPSGKTRSLQETSRTTVKLSTTRNSSDGSSVSDKISLRSSIAPCNSEPEPPYTESPLFPQATTASSTSLPSHAPPPFSLLYFPPPSDPSQLKASVTEPTPNPPPPFTPVSPEEGAETATTGPSRAEAETKAALPADNKGESSKSAEEAEPPPPYTEGYSPLASFTYVMAAAGTAASIITQVQQGAPPPVNTLSGEKGKIDDIGKTADMVSYRCIRR